MRARDLIRSRRSVRAFEARPLPEGMLAGCLDAATWAPNLVLTQPWRFVVLGPSARAALAARCVQREHAVETPAGLRASPALDGCAEAVAVLQVLSAEALVCEADRLAVGAAVQNLLLYAWDEGFAGLWIGGPVAADPEVRAIVGAASDEAVAAIVALGYPESVPPVPRRRAAAELTRHQP